MWVAGSGPPGQRWDLVKRLNQAATVEVAKMSVQSFVSGVKDVPGEKALSDFFDEHKKFESNPDSPEVGFREPRKIRVEFLTSSIERYMDKVTDAEIKQEFDNNKDQAMSNW